ncbi:MAG TPA: LuxR C-terminal-related transcriptional regulator [Anaerolineales bacterium]|nr:LuxR C-terminal-related transcriptional regulator [Anaerolineales bacterium]
MPTSVPTSEKAIIQDNFLIIGRTRVPVGSPVWYEWLNTAKRFSYKGPGGSFVAQCETRRNKNYWYAYRRAGKLSKVYLGKLEELTPERLEQASLSLTGHTLLKHLTDPSGGTEDFTTETRIDTSILPLTKVNIPALPRQLVSRPRLTRQINTPLTLIHAPSGFGKSTLLNEWKQNFGYPVAWLSLDGNDNHIVRFWQSVALALQTVQPEISRALLAYLTTASPVQLPEIISHLTNGIVQCQGTFSQLGLVLDDFHRIHHTEIYDSLQLWLEHFPPNLQLVILGHTKPPLSLGHLRAKGLVTEIDTNDLRFTLEEGIAYLRQYHQETPLAYGDLAKLVKHTEGWAAGLTLTALALGKQENQRQFVDTFSGAHIYMREYFMETVLQRSSPEVQAFLLKTAILKHLNGGLCDAVTGQTGGEEMLLHLWQENLFIVRLDQQGWYRYHDLFAEMLLSQLQARFPGDVPQLHKRAAQWYREQYSPADAVYHLLATEAWEEAALLMEEMALRELEQFGEDSRLLRWLQELPSGVVQKHKTLLFVYLRLALVALPKQKIEHYINQIETQLSNKPVSQQTPDEQVVLVEIQQIRRTWEQGDQFEFPPRHGSENDAKWELLDGMHLLRQVYEPHAGILELPIADLLHKAQSQRNLFVILMAGGVLARRYFVNGQLRRSEKVARQILEQALAQRGKLPEPSSIALSTLSQIYLARNELSLAQKYLTQALEVDPNPTSTNMLVQAAVQRAEIHLAQGNFAEALANLRSIRDFHLRRPSGAWTDQDLLAYEAFIHLRKGDWFAAEQLLNEALDINEHGLAQLIHAEILLMKNQPVEAELLFSELLAQYPYGILSIPVIRIRILLARALFDQHKVNQALQAFKEALRFAAPEQLIRPFLEKENLCSPLLTLALQADNLTDETRAFGQEIMRLSDVKGSLTLWSGAELDALSASASISPREQEVLRLLSDGYSNRELARKLSISESTVKTHIGNIYTKLNVNCRVQAINSAKQLKLV